LSVPEVAASLSQKAWGPAVKPVLSYTTEVPGTFWSYGCFPFQCVSITLGQGPCVCTVQAWFKGGTGRYHWGM